MPAPKKENPKTITKTIRITKEIEQELKKICKVKKCTQQHILENTLVCFLNLYNKI